MNLKKSAWPKASVWSHVKFSHFNLYQKSRSIENFDLKFSKLEVEKLFWRCGKCSGQTEQFDLNLKDQARFRKEMPMIHQRWTCCSLSTGVPVDSWWIYSTLGEEFSLKILWQRSLTECEFKRPFQLMSSFEVSEWNLKMLEGLSKFCWQLNRKFSFFFNEGWKGRQRESFSTEQHSWWSRYGRLPAGRLQTIWSCWSDDQMQPTNRRMSKAIQWIPWTIRV